MSLEGFLYLHRKLAEWEWYDDANTMRLFIHCLIFANYKEKQWRGITIKRGQFITSQPKLAQELKLSVQQIRTALNKLKSTGEITVYVTPDYSVITVKNYNSYQPSNSQDNSLVTDYQQSNNSLITTTNKDNKDNKEKNINKYIKEENFQKNSNSQKLDPFVNPIAEIYKKEYKEITGKKCYLNNQHRNKIIELASDIESFKETIPEVLKKLKNLKFDNIQNFTPSNTWLLKDDNYIKLLEGAFDKYIQKEEIDGWSI